MKSAEQYRREADEIDAKAPGRAESFTRLWRRVADLRESEPQIDPLEHLSRTQARIGFLRYDLGKAGALTDEVNAQLHEMSARIHIAQDELAHTRRRNDA